MSYLNPAQAAPALTALFNAMYESVKNTPADLMRDATGNVIPGVLSRTGVWDGFNNILYTRPDLWNALPPSFKDAITKQLANDQFTSSFSIIDGVGGSMDGGVSVEEWDKHFDPNANVNVVNTNPQFNRTSQFAGAGLTVFEADGKTMNVPATAGNTMREMQNMRQNLTGTAPNGQLKKTDLPGIFNAYQAAGRIDDAQTAQTLYTDWDMYKSPNGDYIDVDSLGVGLDKRNKSIAEGGTGSTTRDGIDDHMTGVGRGIQTIQDNSPDGDKSDKAVSQAEIQSALDAGKITDVGGQNYWKGVVAQMKADQKNGTNYAHANEKGLVDEPSLGAAERDPNNPVDFEAIGSGAKQPIEGLTDAAQSARDSTNITEGIHTIAGDPNATSVTLDQINTAINSGKLNGTGLQFWQGVAKQLDADKKNGTNYTNLAPNGSVSIEGINAAKAAGVNFEAIGAGNALTSHDNGQSDYGTGRAKGALLALLNSDAFKNGTPRPPISNATISAILAAWDSGGEYKIGDKTLDKNALYSAVAILAGRNGEDAAHTAFLGLLNLDGDSTDAKYDEALTWAQSTT